MTEALNHYLDQCDEDFERLGEEGKYEREYSKGWVCPRCGAVYAFCVVKCSRCWPKTPTHTMSDESP